MERVAVLFPGQGSQYVGMGRSYYERCVAAREKIEEAGSLLGWDLRKLLFEDPDGLLARTEYAQPSIVAVSVAVWESLSRRVTIEPLCMAGHSLGEYGALICAGALTFHDGLKLVRKRGELMQEAASRRPGTMVAVDCPDRELLKILCRECAEPEQPVVAACYNTARQTVVSGHAEAVARLTRRLDRLGVRWLPMRVNGAFHSPLMETAAEGMAEALRQAAIRRPERTVLSNLDGRPYRDTDHIRDGLIRQLTSPVRWRETIAHAAGMGATRMIEVAPGRVLSRMLPQSRYRGVVHSLDTYEQMTELIGTLHRDRPRSGALYRDYVERCLYDAFIMRNRSEDPDLHLREVVEPGARVREMLSRHVEFTSGQVAEAMGLIRRMIEAKSGRYDSDCVEAGGYHVHGKA